MPTRAPTIPPPQFQDLNSSLKRDTEALAKSRRQEAVSATRQERVVEAITAFTGSMRFVYLHLAIYGAWILVNIDGIQECRGSTHPS